MLNFIMSVQFTNCRTRQRSGLNRWFFINEIGSIEILYKDIKIDDIENMSHNYTIG